MSPITNRLFTGESKLTAAFVAIALLTLGARQAAFAQGAAPAAGDSVNQKVSILERKLEVKEEAEAAKAVEAPKISAGADGFAIKSADDNFQLKWKGLLQADYRHYVGGQDTGSQRTYLSRYPNNFANTFIARKIRPYFDVTLWKYASFRLVPEFGNGATTLLDAYGELAFCPELKLRVGKFTAPLGIERLQAASDNFFAEYGLTSNLSRSRDVGAQLSGDLSKGAYSYQVGVFNGAIDGANADNDATNHKDIVGRVFLQPFKNGTTELIKGLGIGVSSAWGQHWGDSTNSNLPVYRTAAQNQFFAYRSGVRDSLTVQAKGTYFSVLPQGYWFFRSFGLQGEYAMTSQEAWIPKIAGAELKELTTSAWLVNLSYVVTGESPSLKGVKPRHPLVQKAPGIGAIELVARAGQLKVDEDLVPVFVNTLASAHEATSFGGGVNWYLNPSVKWSLDYNHTTFKGGNRVTIDDRDDEKVITSRLQFAY